MGSQKPDKNEEGIIAKKGWKNRGGVKFKQQELWWFFIAAPVQYRIYLSFKLFWLYKSNNLFTVT